MNRERRYKITALANFLIGVIFIIYGWRMISYSKNYFLYSIGLVVLATAFFIKGLADYLYAYLPKERRKFHFYTFIHYAIAGVILILFNYFGYLYSFLFGIVFLLLASSEFLHVHHLENEKYRIKRHLVAFISRFLIGNFILFDFLFYNVVKPTLVGYILTIIGSLIGFYVIFASVATYDYIKQTSTIPISKAIFS